MSGPKRIVLAAGGTAGHVVPALAVAAALRARGVEVTFAGGSQGMENVLLAAAGEELVVLPGRPWHGRHWAGRFAALATIPVAVLAARRLLAARAADAVIGFGGYVSLGVLVAARQLGIWNAILEPNVEIGMANRRLIGRVNRIYAGTDTRLPAHLVERTLRCGVPLRGSILASAAERRPPAGRTARILVLADSSHSRFLDRAAPAVAHALLRRDVAVEVHHQTSAHFVDDVRARYAGAPATVTGFLDDVAAAYAWADFVIARSGAGTLAELAAAGLPALLVPLAHAAEDHQSRNAEPQASIGAAIVVRERDWRADDVADQLAHIVGDAATWQAMSVNAQLRAQRSSTDQLVDDVLSRWTPASPSTRSPGAHFE